MNKRVSRSSIPVSRNDDPFWPERHQVKLAEAAGRQISLVFAGDSITHAWETGGAPVWRPYYGHRHALNLGFGGDRTEHLLWRLANGEIDTFDPQLFVLMIGTNNLRGPTPNADDTIQGISAIVDLVLEKLPNTQILLLAIFPRGTSPRDPLRQANERVNKKLPELAGRERVQFLNINEHFLSSQGILSPDIAPDLLHLNEEGYKRWAAAIEPVISRLLGDSPVDPSSVQQSDDVTPRRAI